MVFVGALLAPALMATTALAAGPPEAPTTSTPAKSITATTAILEGTLNPGASATAGWYFAYSTEISCALGATTPVEAEVTGEAVKEQIEVTGLEPSRKYTFCMVATSEEGAAATPGNEVTFETKAAPPTVVSEPASSVKASEARLEGLVNPNNQVTECHFQYGTEEASLATSTPVGCELETLEGFGEQVVGLTVAGLAQNTTYYYRVLAKNAKGEETKGSPVETFTTAITPETPINLEAKPVAANTATLNGVLNPAAAGNPGTYEFFYQQSPSECDGEGHKTAPEPAEHATGAEKEPAIAPVKELLPHTQYTFCLRAQNEAAEEALSAPITFTTLAAPPKIEEQSVTDVRSTSATLSATVNPQGAVTTYTFEYAPAGGAFTPVSEPEGSGSIPDGIEGVRLSVHMQQGLVPNAVYEFRLVATNSVEEVTGAASSFTTQRAGGATTLPDGRQYELVTPPDKHGALFYGYGNSEKVIKASVSGDAIALMASQPSESEPQGYANEISVLSTRGVGGWSSQVIAPPHAESAGPTVGNGQEYRFFSEDLSRGIVQPFGNFLALSPEASEATPYLRTDYLHGNVSEHCESSYLSSSSCFRPLVTRADDTASPFQPFGKESNGYCGAPICGPRFVYATPDLSHVVLVSEVQLASTPGSGYYEWSGGGLQLLPGQPAGIGTEGFLHSISADGSRVVLEGGTHLYLRDTNLPSSGDPHAQTTVEIGEGTFQTASGADSRIFFTSGGLLYVYEVDSAHATAVSESADVQGVLGASEDGSYVYFLGAGGRVDVARYGGGEWRTTEGPVVPERSINSSLYRISPNGRYFAFMSSEALTGYDTRDALSGRPDQEVYLYDAAANRLLCASCNRTGARPVGIEFKFNGQLVGNQPEELSVAASIPPATHFEAFQASYQPRDLSDEGRLFFDSHDALVPQDVNGTQDLYEYESPGMGSCTTVGGAYSERAGGCVSLISSGTSPEESAFLDANENGSDVFFLTTSKLAPQDIDHSYDVYDAHVCTSASSCPPPTSTEPPLCITEASCKPAPSAQPSIYGLPASATFSGPGNLAPPPPVLTKKTVKCPKGKKLSRGRCVKAKAKRKKKAHKASKASHHRRPKR